jgi:phosphoribosylglycinamide formyltransferase 1
VTLRTAGRLRAGPPLAVAAAARSIAARSYGPGALSAPLPIAVLVSGAGTNLQALLDSVHGNEAQIVAVASSAPDAPALERASRHGVPARAFPRSEYPDRVARDEAISAWVSEQGARLVVLAGYMELLGERFLERFPGAVINVHPSLLPAFPGLGAIDQALAYGVKVFGVTVHFVDAGVDTGPVILQAAVTLEQPAGAGEVLAALRPLEHELLPRAVRLFAAGALSPDAANPRRIAIGDR